MINKADQDAIGDIIAANTTDRYSVDGEGLINQLADYLEINTSNQCTCPHSTRNIRHNDNCPRRQPFDRATWINRAMGEKVGSTYSASCSP